MGRSRLITKIVAGADRRKSRLHDELGNLVSASRLIRHGPPALLSAIGRLAFGYRSVLPWISYHARRVLARSLTPTSRVLEFGSGMSTLWYARYAGEVVAIENYRPWYDKVERLIAKRRARNIRSRFAVDPQLYTDVGSERGEGFDLVMIDGSHRDRCVQCAVELLRPGGVIYLDNSDKGVDVVTGDVPEARRLLIDFAKAHGAAVSFFTDLAPTQLFAQQGLLVQMPAERMSQHYHLP